MSAVNETKKIAVTGATGQLGQLVIEALLARGVAASNIVALARNPTKATDISAKGVEVREADYAKAETLSSALDGIDRLLLISSNEIGQRAVQHQNVIDAAVKAGVELLAYTSLPKADTSPLKLAAEHKETESAIIVSGIPFVFLRNGWYTENYVGPATQAIQGGTLYSAAADGEVSPATRADYADAAAVVLSGNGFENSIFELGGDEAVTMTELAEIISKISGKDVTYQSLSETDYTAALESAGLPPAYAEILANADAGIATGNLFVDSGDLSRLIERPTTSVEAGLKQALSL